MQDLVKQIVEMDRKARQITEAAQMEKVRSEKEIAERRQQILNDYIERARKRISINEPTERAAAEADWEEKKKKYAELSRKLDELYSQKGDEWVTEIVARVIGE
jgi:predicted ABC-class ATPase